MNISLIYNTIIRLIVESLGGGREDSDEGDRVICTTCLYKGSVSERKHYTNSSGWHSCYGDHQGFQRLLMK